MHAGKRLVSVIRRKESESVQRQALDGRVSRSGGKRRQGIRVTQGWPRCKGAVMIGDQVKANYGTP